MKRFNFDIPEDLLELLRRKAAAEERSMASLLRYLLRKGLQDER